MKQKHTPEQLEKIQKNSNRFVKFGCLPIIILGILYFTINAFTDEPEPEPKKATIKWEDATYEQREILLTEAIEYLDTPTNNLFLNKVIKEKFSYPETVSFDWTKQPLVSRARIVEADEGIVFVDGEGDAKNGFNVPFRFNYSVRIRMTLEGITVEEIFVNKQ